MELRSISASRFETFAGCTRRYKAEYVDKTPRSDNGGPADIGTACHEALENYVKRVYYNKTDAPDIKLLLAEYHTAFVKIFRIADKKDDRYVDGVGMLKNWFKRTDLSHVEIISMEQKSFVEIKTKAGVKKYNYIWDRCDKFIEDGKTIIRVVDYKSYRKNMGPKDVKQKLQFKMYAVAAMIQFKDYGADEVWIMADMLRYGTVEVRFTRDECLEAWREIKETANMIIDLDENNVVETIGPGCTFCVRKATCETLAANVSGGGTFSLLDEDKLAKALYELEIQAKTAKYSIDEIKAIMMKRMEHDDVTQWDTENFTVGFTSKGVRNINPREIALIVGPEVFSSIARVNVGTIDDLIKSGELDEEATEKLRGVFTKTYGAAIPTAKPKEK